MRNQRTERKHDELDVTGMLMKAYVHVDRKEFVEAQELLERVLKREPNNQLVLKYQSVLDSARREAEAEEEDDDEEESSSTSSESNSNESEHSDASGK
eukprot:g1925.t1